MEIMEVRRPQRQSPMQRMMGVAGTGVSNTMTGMQVGKGISAAVPWVKAKIAEMGASEGAGAAAEGSGYSASSMGIAGATMLGAGSGLYDMYHSGQGNQSRSDLHRAVERNTGQDLLEWGITPGKSGEKNYKDQGADYLTKFGKTRELAESNGWNNDTINRRVSMGTVNPKEIISARNSVKDLPLSEPDKINIGNKLSEMLKFIKIG